MRAVFISHAEKDGRVAIELADAIEAGGYTTWYYERDSLPGPAHILQTTAAIQEAVAVLVLISDRSLASVQITSEVILAHEYGKPYLPVLLETTFAELAKRQPVWFACLRASASVSIPPEGPAAIGNRLILGLQALGIQPAHIRSSVAGEGVPTSTDDMGLPKRDTNKGKEEKKRKDAKARASAKQKLATWIEAGRARLRSLRIWKMPVRRVALLGSCLLVPLLVYGIYSQMNRGAAPPKPQTGPDPPQTTTGSTRTDLAGFLSSLSPGNYIVIVGSYSSEAKARSEVERIQGLYPELYSPQVRPDFSYAAGFGEGVYRSGRYYVVYIAGSYSYESADKLKQKAVEELGLPYDARIVDPYGGGGSRPISPSVQSRQLPAAKK